MRSPVSGSVYSFVSEASAPVPLEPLVPLLVELIEGEDIIYLLVIVIVLRNEEVNVMLLLFFFSRYNDERICIQIGQRKIESEKER